MIMKPRWILLSVFAAVLLALLASPARAQESQPTDDDVNRIAKQLYCPVCENIPLDVCPTVACEQWRETIREKLAQGWDENQIKDYFVAQYGDRVLATPPAKGLNWLVYILPPLAFLFGAIILIRAFRNLVKTPVPEISGPEATQDADDDPYVAQFEELLQQRDAG